MHQGRNESGLLCRGVLIYLEKIQNGKSEIEVEMKKLAAKSKRSEKAIQGKVFNIFVFHSTFLPDLDMG
jgi:hypothetical protein